MNEDGEVLKPPVQLTKLGIYRVRDLKFKRGTRGYNQQGFQQIKIIQRRIPASLDGNTVESDLIGYSRKYPHPHYGRHRIAYPKISGFPRRTTAVFAGFQSLLIQNLEEFQNFAKISWNSS